MGKGFPESSPWIYFSFWCWFAKLIDLLKITISCIGHVLCNRLPPVARLPRDLVWSRIISRNNSVICYMLRCYATMVWFRSVLNCANIVFILCWYCVNLKLIRRKSLPGSIPMGGATLKFPVCFGKPFSLNANSNTKSF